MFVCEYFATLIAISPARVSSSAESAHSRRCCGSCLSDCFGVRIVVRSPFEMVANESGETPRPMIGAMFRGPGPAYKLPSETGYEGHDFTKLKAPAYSFRLKGSSKFKDDCSPGPSRYRVQDKVTRFGGDGSPMYSLHGRPKTQSAFTTPGPDAYRAESVPPLRERTAPAYSFGGRTKYSQREKTPGPNSYTLPDLLGGGGNKIKSPAYSLTGRSKVGGFHQDLQKTPGPGAYNSADPNNYRKRQPLYSISGRNFIPGDATVKPGPGTYRPEMVYVNKRIAPKFSFGIRHSEYTAPVLFSVE